MYNSLFIFEHGVRSHPFDSCKGASVLSFFHSRSQIATFGAKLYGKSTKNFSTRGCHKRMPILNTISRKVLYMIAGSTTITATRATSKVYHMPPKNDPRRSQIRIIDDDWYQYDRFARVWKFFPCVKWSSDIGELGVLLIANRAIHCLTLQTFFRDLPANLEQYLVVPMNQNATTKPQHLIVDSGWKC
jgi:hypothetical protein